MDAMSDRLPYPHPRRRPTQTERARSEKEIQRIEGEISNLTDKVGKLQDQIDEWQRIKANHLSFIASFRCLPEELLTEILRLSLNSDVSHGTLSSICGTIRGIVIGTSTFWNRIRIHNRRPGLLPSAISSGIPCHKRVHLDFILTCASATPLDLWVDSDTPEHRIELLELVVSHGCEISSLTLDSLEDELVLDPTLKILNLRALNVLSMNNLSREAIEKVMDLALQSDQGEMRIVMSPKPEENVDSLLLHSLLQRPGHLELCLAHDFSTRHISTKISLPQLKTLRIPDKSLLDMFDLNHVENLDIWGIAPYMPRFTSDTHQSTGVILCPV
ncbi:hypothetical protein CPB86DRAFT_829069 [Serendipita vermifera]|nr:hypothetical protein CPB86DRAFT_829069 [Serendipita vermifera]